MPIATPHTRASMAIWITLDLCCQQGTHWRCVCFTYQTDLSLLGVTVWKQHSHQYYKFMPHSTGRTTCELLGKSMWPLHICKIWQTRLEKEIHSLIPAKSGVLKKKKNNLLLKTTLVICQVISPSQPTSLADFLCKAQACKHSSSFTNASIVYENKQIAQRQYTISQYLREKSLNISNKALEFTMMLLAVQYVSIWVFSSSSHAYINWECRFPACVW